MFYVHPEKGGISYEELLKKITSSGFVFTSSAISNTSDFFVNLIKSIVHNKDITLVDPLHPDNSTDEKISIGDIDISSLGVLREKIKGSTSKITVFTSGTTGQPKKVTHNLSNLLRQVRVHEKHKASVWAFAYNPTHMAGLQVLFQALCNFNTLVDVFGQSKSSILSALKDNYITHISATPTFYRLLLPIENPMTNVKSVSLGGEKSDEKLINSLTDSFPNARIFNIYASTEAGTLFSAHGVHFIIKEDMRHLIKVVDNELCIHNSLTGNYSEQEKSEWYQTGDVIEWVDEKKLIFKFASRKNEMINVGGNKVNPHDIESKLMQITGIDQCYVYGKPNSLLGNMIYADIVLSDQEVTEVQIKKELRESCESFEIPRKIQIVDNLQTTRTGKLKRN